MPRARMPCKGDASPHSKETTEHTDWAQKAQRKLRMMKLRIALLTLTTRLSDDLTK